MTKGGVSDSWFAVGDSEHRLDTCLFTLEVAQSATGDWDWGVFPPDQVDDIDRAIWFELGCKSADEAKTKAEAEVNRMLWECMSELVEAAKP